MVQLLWESPQQLSKVNKRPRNSLPSPYSREMKMYGHTKMYKYIFKGSIIFNGQKATQMSIIWWMDKLSVISPYNRILFSNAKGMKYWYISQHRWTLKTICQVRGTRSKRPHTEWFHLCAMSRVSKSIKAESRFFSPQFIGAGRRGNGEWLLIVTRFLLEELKLFWN